MHKCTDNDCAMWWFHAGNKGQPLHCVPRQNCLAVTHALKPELLLLRLVEFSSGGVPGDVLIVEDDPIIALDFEDTVLRLGVKTVRAASSVSRALQLIEECAPDFYEAEARVRGASLGLWALPHMR